MASKEDIRDTLLEEMKDPALEAEVFDEFNRRLQLLDEEE